MMANHQESQVDPHVTEMLLPGRVLDPGLPRVKERVDVDLEEALDIAGVGKYQLLHCSLMVTILGASLLEIIGSAFVLPAAVCDLDISDSIRGLVTCLPNIGIILTATVWGRLSDTWGRRPVLLLSCAASGLLGAAAALMPGLLSYAVCKLAASLFLSAPSSLTFAYGGELVPRRRRDLAVLLLSALLMMSSTLSPVLAWLILPHDWRLSLGYISFRPWRLLTLAYAAPLLVCAGLLVPAHESPKFLLTRGRADQALRVLRRIYARNSGMMEEKYPVKSLKQHSSFMEESRGGGDEGSMSRRGAVGAVQLLLPPHLKWMALIGFLMFGVFCLLNGLFLFSPDTINKVMTESPEKEGTICILMEQSSQNQTTNATCIDTISTGTFIIMAGTTFIYATIVLLVSISPLSKKSLLVTTYLVVVVACLMSGLLRNKMAAAVAMSALQLTALGVGPLTAYAVDLFPTALRGTAVSATLMFGRVGSVAGANVAGVSLAAHCSASFYGFTALLLGFGMYNIANMLLSGNILMGMIMQTLGLSFVIPAAQCDLDLSLQQKGWLAAIPFIAIILTSHLWGWLADTRGRRPILIACMAISVIFFILSSFSPNLPVFATLQFIACFFTSGPSGIVYAYLGESNSLHHRDKMVAFGASFVGIGTVLLPAFSWLILPLEFSYPISFLGIHYRSWRLLVVACTIPYAVSCFLMIWASESPKYLNASGQEAEVLRLLKKMYAVNKRASEDDFPIKAIINENPAVTTSTRTGIAAVLVSMRDQTVPLFRPPLLMWTCLACFVQMGIMATSNGFYVWFPSILNSLANHVGEETKMCDVLGAQSLSENDTVPFCDDTVNVLTFERAILVGLVFCSMYIIVGLIVDLVGKKPILVILLGATGVCGIACSLVPSQSAAVSLFAIFQMSGACIGLTNAVVVELFPTRLRAMAVCLSLMFGRVGSVVGSNIIGILLESNCPVSFYLFGGLLIVCSALCLTLPGKQKKAVVATKTQAPENHTDIQATA